MTHQIMPPEGDPNLRFWAQTEIVNRHNEIQFDRLRTDAALHPDGTFTLSAETLRDLALRVRPGDQVRFKLPTGLVAAEPVAPEENLHFAQGAVVLDCARQLLEVEEQPIALTHKEFGLLKVLGVNAGQYLSREAIGEAAWGPEHAAAWASSKSQRSAKTIDVHVRRSRQKLGPYDWILRTRRHVGYAIDDTPL